MNHYLSENNRESAVKNCYQALKKGGIFFSFENIALNSEKRETDCFAEMAELPDCKRKRSRRSQ